MARTVIGAQLYTVREFTQTEEDFRESMRKVSEAGYRAVQLSAHGPIGAEVIGEVLDEYGLRAAATHVGLPDLQENLDRVIEEHHTWNCEHVAIGAMPGEYRNEEGYSRFAREVSEIARELEKNGLTFSYHNHSFELEKFSDGRTGLEILCEESDPEVFNLEIDTYWIQHGGADPAAWIRRVSGRIPLVHFKDMAIMDNEQIMAEVGEGNLNWPEIVEACKEAGAEWYLVEQDVCQRDPFESLEISLNNMREMGLE